MAPSLSSTFSSSLLKWMDIQVLLVSTIVFLLLADIMRRRRPKTFPPGLLCWPVIGNTVTIDFKKAHLEMCRSPTTGPRPGTGPQDIPNRAVTYDMSF
ncbi:hypothetical protein AALO_G00122970 [Alosa alosa]|uniref:Uncharacterized protein n=1 Tax=Alosa alosa TaxID=278164 RepID=A0AAV6GKD4_9TELE|nr:hypothetical protein AALO_G00122970 [Alosa alosa]